MSAVTLSYIWPLCCLNFDHKQVLSHWKTDIFIFAIVSVPWTICWCVSCVVASSALAAVGVVSVHTVWWTDDTHTMRCCCSQLQWFTAHSYWRSTTPTVDTDNDQFWTANVHPTVVAIFVVTVLSVCKWVVRTCRAVITLHEELLTWPK